MAKNKRSEASKKKAKHRSLMMEHMKRSIQKKQVEAFQQMMRDRAPQGKQENVSETPETMVDIEDIEIIDDAIVDDANGGDVESNA